MPSVAMLVQQQPCGWQQRHAPYWWCFQSSECPFSPQPFCRAAEKWVEPPGHYTEQAWFRLSVPGQQPSSLCLGQVEMGELYVAQTPEFPW